jgi:predicted nucleic acid-binding protein
MIVLADANVLLRLADPTSPTHAVAGAAAARLRAQGDSLQMVPQSIYEFWAVATRPIAHNGLGLSGAECVREVGNLKALFPLLNDKPTLLSEWEAVVFTFACHGKAAHDARYIAAMRTHGLTHLLTFNVSDFSRYTGFTILDPNIIATSGPAPPTKVP